MEAVGRNAKVLRGRTALQGPLNGVTVRTGAPLCSFAYEPHPFVSVVSPVVGPLCVWVVAARVARKCYVMLCYVSLLRERDGVLHTGLGDSTNKTFTRCTDFCVPVLENGYAKVLT